MKQGRSLTELAMEIERQKSAAVDYIAPTDKIAVEATNDSSVALAIPNAGLVGIRPHAHRQIAERLQIPAKYYDRMLAENPGLLATNINAWFHQTPEPRMLRTLDGNLRAFLSNRYRRFDYWQLMEGVLPLLAEYGPGVEIVSSEITELRLYLKVKFPNVLAEVKRGDVVASGAIIQSSDVGAGAISVYAFVTRLVCVNGMKIDQPLQRRAHLGRIEDTDEARTLYRDDTLLADDRALMLKVRDSVSACMDEARFKDVVDVLRASTERQLGGSIERGVEVLAQQIGLNETERGSVLRHLIEGGDLSQWGVANAITRMAGDVPSYDRATELETAGWNVITLAPSEWEEIATAKAA